MLREDSMKTKINEVPKDNLLTIETGGVVVVSLLKNIEPNTEEEGYLADVVTFTLRPELNLRERILAKFDWYWDKYTAVALNRAKGLKIIELQQLLAKTDYEAIKYGEGAIDADQYIEMAAARAAWRLAINKLEACKTLSEVEAVKYSVEVPIVKAAQEAEPVTTTEAGA